MPPWITGGVEGVGGGGGIIYYNGCKGHRRHRHCYADTTVRLTTVG